MNSFENTPDYPSPYKMGQKLNLKRHWYNEKNGGTKEGGPISVEVSYMFWDYEVGWRFHGRPSKGLYRKVYFHSTEVIA